MKTKVALWLAVFGVLIGSASIGVPTTEASAPVCCTLGNDCQSTQYCCTPESLGALPCSTATEGYCRESCKK